MNRLSFEDLMELFSDAKKERNFDEITKIKKEFERRVKKRKLMGKKPMRTSLSGLNQTSEWLNNNSDCKKDRSYRKQCAVGNPWFTNRFCRRKLFHMIIYYYQY